MKKKTLGFLVATIVALVGYVGVSKPSSDYKVLLSSNVTYADNYLSQITNANPDEFDNPAIDSNGVLNRMSTTQIQTKYGNMQITQENHGYECKNLSQNNAPVLYVSVVNDIYEVDGQAAAQETISPKIIGGDQDRIILPNINTSKPCFSATYVEAIGNNGEVTIAPFIYNTIKFKENINVKSLNDVQSLNTSDVLDNENNSLRDLNMYIANYKQGSNTVNIGISRGMASVQKQVQLNVQNNQTKLQEINNTKTQVNTELNQEKIPVVAKILLGKAFYIILGIILIALVVFFCFI